MKILLLNSDLAKNRGDRAIAEGVIQILKQKYPTASITGLSEQSERDKQWFGVDFLQIDSQSLNPHDFIRLYRSARASDLVVWGGGEILKDYTNKAALWYWVAKITALSTANRRIVGFYQGIGPTKSPMSKRLIAWVVGRCEAFVVRDKESYNKLVAWGANPKHLFWSSDPAVIPEPAPLSPTLIRKLKNDFEINPSFMDSFICIGPRDWFHYKTGGVIPFKYRKKLPYLFGGKDQQETDEHRLYVANLKELIKTIQQKHNKNILLTPMHMLENDTELCQILKETAPFPAHVKILSKDTLSPPELRSVIAQAKAMVGFRLHSNIIGVSASVPSINIYYVDKGRVFFEQINQQKNSFPIESVLDDNFISIFDARLSKIYDDRKIRNELQQSNLHLQKMVTVAADDALND